MTNNDVNNREAGTREAGTRHTDGWLDGKTGRGPSIGGISGYSAEQGTN